MNILAMKKSFFIILFIFCLLSCDNNYKTEDTFQLIYTDVDNFWKMYDKVKTIQKEGKRVEIIKIEYLDKATLVFKKLIKKDKLTPKRFSNYLKDTLFYNSIRQSSFDFKKDSTTIKNTIKSFSKIYPKAKYSDVYFVIGLFNHGGVVLDRRIIFQLETNAKTKFLKSAFLINKQQEEYLNFKSSFTSTVFHEQVHLSQKNKNRKTLLGDAIVEGSANLLMYLQTNNLPSTIEKTYEYGLKNEFEVWQRFKLDMQKERISVQHKWFNNYGAKNIIYPDLGYFIGHKICESYYNNAKNKQEAVAFLLTEKNFNKILALSNYNGGK